MLLYNRVREILSDNPEENNPKLEDGEIYSKNVEGHSHSKYYMHVTFGENTYVVVFEHTPNDPEGEFAVSFVILDKDNSTVSMPVTNAGLEVFGKLADEMSRIYEKITSEQSVKQLRIYPTYDVYSKDDITNASSIIAENKEKIDGATVKGNNYTIDFKGANAFVKIKNALGITTKTHEIPLTDKFLEDIKYMTGVDPKDAILQMLGDVTSQLVDDPEKKAYQRLKLYQFYLHKRFPKFTFNSKTLIKDGKKDIEFEKDEDGQLYLLVNTNS